ncbi:Lsr2 dimerization domain-containing protein [Streptomonospora arabica]|uniref:Histone-like nucleoid-structuring protein Lsr2 n=1 Tax=Streptomonospora arabica TaxID=412417 RepID=A0ABV9SSP7_9ACTN
MSEPKLLIARTSAVITEGRRSYRIKRGQTVVRADDPVVRGREHLFRELTVTRLGHRATAEPTPPRPARTMEDATAVPGRPREADVTAGAPVEPEPEQPREEPAEQSAEAADEPASEEEAPEPSTREVRAWARENGMDVPSRGRVPDEVVAAYKRAHGHGW